MPEHVRLLIAWIRLIIARGAFGEDESNKSPMRLVDECSLIEQISTHALAEPNEYIRILMKPCYCWESLYKNTRYTGDRLIVLVVVQQFGSALEYASPELRGDREIVLTAVKQYGDALYYASEELRRDREIVLEAVRNDAISFRYASQKLRGDRDIALIAVQQRGYNLEFASEEVREQLKKEGY